MFFTYFSVWRAIKDYVMKAGPLWRLQRPRPAKRSGEFDYDAVQVAVEGEILCCGVKQNYHFVADMDSPNYDEKLAVYSQGLCGAPTLACHVLCRQRK